MKLFILLISCWSGLVFADAIQPLPRPIPGKTERQAEPIDTTPTAPMNMRLQQSRVWKQAKVTNMRVTESFLMQHEGMPGVKKSKTGLHYEVLQKGTGDKPKKTDVIVVTYQGRLVDGTAFVDATNANVHLDTIKPAGLKQALANMHVGSRWQIVVPPDLGYGDDGAPPTIGPGAALIYDIEVQNIQQTQASN